MARVWTTKRKEKISITEMSIEHLQRAISMLKDDIKLFNAKILDITSKSGYIKDLATTQNYDKVVEYSTQINLAKAYQEVLEAEVEKRRIDKIDAIYFEQPY